MDCLAPVILKSGLAVPCGKCAICRSNARNEWSIRLAIHLASCDRMPMFITLTYDDEHLPMVGPDGLWYRRSWPSWSAYHRDELVNVPTLVREDISTFLKRYKRKYGLTNDKFQYFGCGEMGDMFQRPHFHLLFFGDNELYEDFFKDSQAATDRIRDVWHMGFVYVGIADYSGIHYCTKYVLKDSLDDYLPLQKKPFTVASNGLGMNFLKTKKADAIRKRLEYLAKNPDSVIKDCPSINVDEPSTILNAIRYLKTIIPSFEVILDDGRKVFLPRAIRRKLIGSFEHFKDSPLWYYNHLLQLYDSLLYYGNFGEYDESHQVNFSREKLQNRLEKIQKRLLKRKYDLKFKR